MFIEYESPDWANGTPPAIDEDKLKEISDALAAIANATPEQLLAAINALSAAGGTITGNLEVGGNITSDRDITAGGELVAESFLRTYTDAFFGHDVVVDNEVRAEGQIRSDKPGTDSFFAYSDDRTVKGAGFTARYDIKDAQGETTDVREVFFGIGNSGTNYGIYSESLQKWILVVGSDNVAKVHAIADSAATLTTTLPVAKGGTGATTKKTAKTNLGITVGDSAPSGSASSGDIYFQY